MNTLYVVFLLIEVTFLSFGVSNESDNAEFRAIKKSLLDDPDISVTDRILLVNQESSQQGIFEGDIVLTDQDHVDTSSTGDIGGPLEANVKRNAQRSRLYLWTTRVVPYEIDTTAITGIQLTKIQTAITEFNSYSCLKWIPKRSEDKQWVKFIKGKGCLSSVGRENVNDGPQTLSLGSGCYYNGIILHEMLHASGFWHEQSRPDRDQYVEVLWENIIKGYDFAFDKYSHGKIDSLNTNYDYNSVMHYGNSLFSKNRLPTLKAIGNPNKVLGASSLSAKDKLKLNALYDCKTPSGGWSSWTEYGPCLRYKNCYKTRERFCTAEDRSKVCPEANQFGIQNEEVKCSDKECQAPIDGHWGHWSAWGSCSTTCDKGTKTRTRVCGNPAPKNGGVSCPGSKTQTLECNLRSCSKGCSDKNDQCSYWKKAGYCASSSSNYEYMSRICPKTCGFCGNGGKAPVDGHWGRWSAWGSCSTTCDNGIKTRTRVCDDPAPKNGGASCPGSKTQTLECNLRSCSKDCSDISNYCHGWVIEGDCATSSSAYGYMIINCRKSCGFCGNGGKECSDKRIDCPSMATRGYCAQSSVLQGYMIGNCRKTCEFCSS